MARISDPDTSPRTYPEGMVLVRRSAKDPSLIPEHSSVDDVAEWLLTDALKEEELLDLFEQLAWRLASAGLPLNRASLHVGTLHPQLIGFTWIWSSADGICDEMKVADGMMSTDSYRRSPLFRVIEHGEHFRAHGLDPSLQARYPLMKDLAREGITDYLAMPLGPGKPYHEAITVATRLKGGFSEEDIRAFSKIKRLFALHVERHMALRIANNVITTYLGRAAAKKVLEGSIKRGSGDAICSIIWVSDLRGFTDLSDRLAARDVLTVLNAYYEVLAGAVISHGGEVLKFIGDGLLAVFPYTCEEDSREAAEAALAAAGDAQREISRLNRQPPAALAPIGGWNPLRTGIAIHDGEVFFGNVGAPERLDFTVIGRAVNEASRVEAMSKPLGRSILITGKAARHLKQPLEDLGQHHLRGLAEPVTLFAPRSPLVQTG